MHDTENPTQSSAADAAGLAADYSARATYARGWEDGRKSDVLAIDLATDLAAAIRQRDEVGIQYDAAQAMIARLMPVVDAARVVADHAGPKPAPGLAPLRTAIRALDTVPGDVLARLP